MTGYSKNHNRIVSGPGTVENSRSQDAPDQAAPSLGKLKAAGRQAGFVNAVEFNLVAALLVLAMIIGKATIG